jgi:Stage II sporulation protein E (SpoIIE)
MPPSTSRYKSRFDECIGISPSLGLISFLTAAILATKSHSEWKDHLKMEVSKHSLALLALCCLSIAARAQGPSPQPADHDHDDGRAPLAGPNFVGSLQIVSLDGLWRFHPGDNAAWADPEFDDSGWPLLRSDESWSVQGYKNMSGYGWYRFSVVPPPGVGKISMSFPPIYTSYEIYANGILVGAFGRMPPHYSTHWGGRGEEFVLPWGALSRPKLEIAIRVWNWKGHTRMYGGGPNSGGSVLGASAEVERRNAMLLSGDLFRYSPAMVVALLEILAGIGALALYSQRRSDREYLWFAAMMLSGAVYGIWVIYQSFVPLEETRSDPYRVLLTFVLFPLAELLFYAELLNAPRSRWFRFVFLCDLMTLGASLLCLWPIGEYDFPIVQVMITTFAIPQYIWILNLVIRKAREHYVDARLLLIPAVLQTLVQVWNRENATSFTLGWQHRTGLLTQIMTEPVRLDAMQLANAVFLLAVFAILAFRFTRTSVREEQYATEVEAARSVQRYLIPELLPETPGLRIQSAYRPAREVGGDFFQVLPDATDGSTLVVVGDVAGKGLQAGMSASLIVGAIRTANEFTRDPGKILALLNQRLQGRGLVTCLALRVERDGVCALANAGHLAPYLNGRELSLEGALPLGAVPGVDFPAVRFHLRQGDALTLLSDGVVEARNVLGELFGFERTRTIIGQSAEAIAEAAQHFGQEDDITVLTLQFAPS